MGTDRTGVYRSTDAGLTWAAAASGLTSKFIYSICTSGASVFAATPGGVFVSSNKGGSWTEVSTGLTHLGTLSLAVLGTDLYTGVIGNGVWRRPLSEMVTGVEEVAAALPGRFELMQNYPNPFKSSTTIRYGLPNKTTVMKLFTRQTKLADALSIFHWASKLFSRTCLKTVQSNTQLCSLVRFYRTQRINGG